jgi:hypothetical protein
MMSLMTLTFALTARSFFTILRTLVLPPWKGSVAEGAPFGRQTLQLNQTAEREAESAADQAPLRFSLRSCVRIGTKWKKLNSDKNSNNKVIATKFLFSGP